MAEEQNNIINKMLSYFCGKKILITGGNGYIASNLVHKLKNIDCTIVRADRAFDTPTINGRASIRDVIGDIKDKSFFEGVLESIDIVYHFAAQTSLYQAEKNPMDDFSVNVVPMLNLLETCRYRGWKPAIIFSGTVTEVGIPKNLPVNETCCDCPVSIYDMHKLMAENYLKYYSKRGIVFGTVLRLANVYGPGPKSSSSDRGVLNMMIRKALAEEPLNIYGTGEYLRDYIFVEDVVRAFLEAAIHKDQVNEKYFIIGSGEGIKLSQAVNLVADRAALKTGKRVPVRHVDPPSILHPVEFRNFIADPKLFMNSTDWKINFSLIKGIDCTIDYFSGAKI